MRKAGQHFWGSWSGGGYHTLLFGTQIRQILALADTRMAGDEL